MERWRKKLQHASETGSFWSHPEEPDPRGSFRHLDASQGRAIGPGSSAMASDSARSRRNHAVSRVPSIETAINKHQAYSTFFTDTLTAILIDIIDGTFAFGLSGPTGSSTPHAFHAGTAPLHRSSASPRQSFLEELAAEAEVSPRQRLLQEMADIQETSYKKHRSPRAIFEEMAHVRPLPPAAQIFEASSGLHHADGNESFFEELASAASLEKAASVYSVPSVYRSTLDELADASELANLVAKSSKPLSFFEEIANSIPRDTIGGSQYSHASSKGRGGSGMRDRRPTRLSISPEDSASQVGSESRSLALSEDRHSSNNGDTTDAAKLLFMFGAQNNTSPKRQTLFPRQTSPERRYFQPGLV
ncbi:hypothetical protein HDU91_006197 [Kappamyces sp. JEL0680]|nr:hypothetical protein HDU91_006197 [Kappamyces sp. JEL0680]